MTATPEVLLDGLIFPEGPRWHGGRFWFSDMHAHKILTLDGSGHAETVAELDDRPSGLGWLPDGRMLVVAMGARKVLRLERSHLVEHADLSELAPADCNDMVVDASGRAYVGNFGFDFAGGGTPASTNIIAVEPEGRAWVAAEGLQFPNGSVITPDGKTLIVGETFGRKLTAFDIGKDGKLSNQRLFAEVRGAFPDGICLDAEGAVWVASPPTSEFIRVREGGEVAERIPVPGKQAVACMLGGDDRKTLYLCTAIGTNDELREGKTKGLIETVRVEIAGAGLP